MTNYWVKKIQKGTLWELYCSQEESLSYREYCGTYEADELRAYFEEVDFDLEEDDVFPEGEPDFDTLAGWVTQLIGDLPEVGKVVTIAGLNVEVTEVERQRVQRLRISKVISKGFESEEK